MMNYIISGGTGALDVPWIRVPNLLLLAGTVALTGYCLVSMGQSGVLAGTALAVPMAWVCAGMAITEALGLCGISLAAAGAIGWSKHASEGDIPWRWAILYALGLVVATTTRQSYLAAVPGLAMLAPLRRSGWRLVIGVTIAALVPICLVFGIWGGLLPPAQRSMSAGYSIAHLGLAFAITGVVTLIIAPGFLWRHRSVALVAGMATGLAQFVLQFAAPTTLTSVQRFFPGDQFAAIMNRVVNVGFIAAAGMFVGALAAALWNSRDRVLWGSAGAVFGLCVAAGAVTRQFSSRYPAMALPLLILVLAPWIRCGPWLLVRVTGGSLLGLAVLHSYYCYA
ncbi:hypothetical protein [Opitutus sp. ER46]|uniref:hypothetical protein n=1 Tax=Opitutus sp. ER46 TaxID=2161864 RepID=UPI000D30988B|nr:hypothetical protein [Opitutus sp. ER46]PTX91085.1 hypothetical protein DB354_20840 [Opitutus sp. ER46]